MEDLKFVHEHGLFTPEFATNWQAFHEEVERICNNKNIGFVHLQISGTMVGIDYDQASLIALQDRLLIDQVYLQLLQIRRTLALLHAANVVVSVIGDPVGLCFEMALAGKHCFTIGAQRYGIAEIEFGLFPMFGICEQAFVSERLLRRDIEAMPLRGQATLRDWQEFFTEVNAEQFLELLSGFQRNLKQSGKKAKVAVKIASTPLSEALYRKLGHDFPFSNYEWRTKRPWNLVWGMLRDRLEKKDRAIFECSVNFLNARMLLGSQFLIWLERRLQYQRLGLKHVAPAPLNPVIVDLEYLVPPVEPIIKLINHGYPIIFATYEAAKLKEALDLLGTRLERSLEKTSARDIWRNSVFWTQTDVPQSRQGYYILRWYPDDRVSIVTAADSTTILRFQGNRGNSRSGWGELSAAAHNPELFDRASVQLLFNYVTA